MEMRSPMSSQRLVKYQSDSIIPEGKLLDYLIHDLKGEISNARTAAALIAEELNAVGRNTDFDMIRDMNVMSLRCLQTMVDLLDAANAYEKARRTEDRFAPP